MSYVYGYRRIHSLMYTACYPIRILTFLCEL